MTAAACPIGSQDLFLQNRHDREVAGEARLDLHSNGGGEQGAACHLLIN